MKKFIQSVVMICLLSSFAVAKGEVTKAVPLVPTVTITDVSKNEGNSGKTDFVFHLTFDKPVPKDAGFWYTVTDGSDGDNSYSGAYVVDSHPDNPEEQDVYGFAKEDTNNDQYIKLPKGVTEYDLTISVKGDDIPEPVERFFLDLYAQDNLVWSDSCKITDEEGNDICRANGIILNDDQKTIAAIHDVSKSEGNSGTTDFAFNISLSEPAKPGMDFWYTVTDGSDGDENEYPGAYLSDHDMHGESGCIEIVDSTSSSSSFDVYGSHDESCQQVPKGVENIVLHVNVNGDTKYEPDERFFVDLYAQNNLTWSDSCKITNEEGNDICRANGIILNDDQQEEELSPQDCSKAPENLLTFNKDFDFDKNNDVTGNGGVGTVARYKNVATYNGEDLDLLVKVEDLKNMNSLYIGDSTPKGFKFQKVNGSDPSVGFFIDQKRSDPKDTVYDATLRFTYVKHGTNEPVAVNFETQVYDIDNFYNRTEKVVINKDDYKFFQLSEDSHIEGVRQGDEDSFTNTQDEDSQNFDPAASVKFVHEQKSTFTVHFQHIKNKSTGQYGGKAGFNLVFGKTESGLGSCQHENRELDLTFLTPFVPGDDVIATVRAEGVECTAKVWMDLNGDNQFTNNESLHLELNQNIKAAESRNMAIFIPDDIALGEKSIKVSCGSANSVRNVQVVTDKVSECVNIDTFMDGNITGWRTQANNSETHYIETSAAMGGSRTVEILPAIQYGSIAVGSASGQSFYAVSDSSGTPKSKIVWDGKHQGLHLGVKSDEIISVHFTDDDGGVPDLVHNVKVIVTDKGGHTAQAIKLAHRNITPKGTFTDYNINFTINELDGASSLDLNAIEKIELMLWDDDGAFGLDYAIGDVKLCNRTTILPIECSDKAIVIDYKKSERNNPVQIVHEIDLATGVSSDHTMESEDLNGSYINGFGYNAKDGFLWGNDVLHDRYLVKVGRDSDGNYIQKRVGPIDGLDEGFGSFAGDFDNDGYLYLYRQNKMLYKIDTDARKVVKKIDFKGNISGIQAKNITTIADIAFNPKDKNFYGLDKNNNFYRLSATTGKMDCLGKGVIDYGAGIYGTAFFDNSGHFYAIKNKNRKAVRIAINKDQINATEFSSINIAQNKYNNDGARCNQAPIKLDYADAPDSYGSSLSSDGARHKLPAFGDPKLYIGSGVSAENDARLVDADDDTPVTFTPLYVSSTNYSVSIPLHNGMAYTAHLAAWIDFNRDDIFESGEGITADVLPGDHTVTLRWTVPADIKAGGTYMRVRVSTDALTTGDMTGVKSDGEVEDYKLTIYANSAYDAADDNSSIIDVPRLRTQIVGKPFTPVLAKIAGDLNDTDMRVAVVDASVCENPNSVDLSTISGFKPFALSKQTSENGGSIFTFFSGMVSDFMGFGAVSRSNPLIIPEPPTFTVDKAMKKAKLFFVWRKNGVQRRACSSDAFAVRPDRFVIESLPSNVKAGETFTMHIKAVDNSTNHNAVAGYNEKLVLNSSGEGSVSMDYNETKPKCTVGTLELSSQNVQFHDGVADLQLKYPEIGELNVTIREIPGKEFAIVDKNDSAGTVAITPVKDRKLGFAPAKLAFTWHVSNGDGSRYTYYNTLDTSINNSDPMAARLTFEAKVLNENDLLVKNFKPECYAKDIAVNIDAAIHAEHPATYTIRARYPDNNGTASFTHLPSSVSTSGSTFPGLTIDKSLFKEGEASKRIEFNIQRDASLPMNPMIYTFSSATASLDDLNSTKPNSDQNLTFLYVRAHIPDQQIIGKEGGASVFYEVYCKDCNTSKYGLNGLPESVDSVYWYQWSSIAESSKVFDPDFEHYNKIIAEPEDVTAVFTPGITAISQDTGANKLNLKVSKAPFKTRIHYKPKKYLIYNRFNAGADKQSFIVDFKPKPKSWAGKGKLGMTVDTNIAPRNNMDIIDW